MEARSVLSVDEIHLGDLEFWRRPIEEREGAFATLRAERPVSFHGEPELEFRPKGPGYWAVTKHADILEVSRTPEIYCSGKGVNLTDLPPQLNEFFGSMIAMDDPGRSPRRPRPNLQLVHRGLRHTGPKGS